MTEKHFEALEAVMFMVDQFFPRHEDGVLYHRFMQAEERAISVLLQAGLAVKVEKGYELKHIELERLRGEMI